MNKRMRLLEFYPQPDHIYGIVCHPSAAQVLREGYSKLPAIPKLMGLTGDLPPIIEDANIDPQQSQIYTGQAAWQARVEQERRKTMRETIHQELNYP
jgi:hypothetical protein